MKANVQGRLLVVSAMLWTTSVALMVVAPMFDRDTLRGWSVLVGLWACVATGWLLLDHERQRVETIARLLAGDKPPEGLRRL